MRLYTDSELENLLNTIETSEKGLEEDLLIIQPDGTKACLNWELRNGSYSLMKEYNEKPLEKMTDEELLQSAYAELKRYKVTSEQQN